MSLTPPLDPDLLLERLDAALRSRDADELEIAVLARAGEYTRFAGDTIHQPQDITEVQYLVRAVVDGHACRAATTVATNLADTVALAASGARTRAAAAATPGQVDLPVAHARPDEAGPRFAGLWFDDVEAFDTAGRVRSAQRAMRAATDADGEIAGMFGRAVTQQAVATTHGTRRCTAATEASGSVTAGVGDGTAHWIDLGRSAARLDVDHAVATAIAQAVASQGREALPDGSYEVVLGSEATGELLQFLPELGFAGDLAADGIGLCVTARDRLLAAPCVDVADDAGADVGLPIGFDIEGVTKQRVPFFTQGRVGTPVTDTATAATLGGRSTGHAHIAREQVPAPQAANIVMAPGVASEADLIAAVERGVYVQRFWYTRLVDRVAGTVTGVTRDACFLIEDGRLTRPLEGMRFTQSVTRCLADVVTVGRDMRSQPVMNVWNGATSAPPVHVRAFRLGANPAP